MFRLTSLDTYQMGDVPMVALYLDEDEHGRRYVGCNLCAGGEPLWVSSAASIDSIRRVMYRHLTHHHRISPAAIDAGVA